MSRKLWHGYSYTYYEFIKKLCKTISKYHCPFRYKVEVVDPPDFEECVISYKGALEKDPLQYLLDFPSDDLKLNVIQKKQRISGPVVLEKG